MVCLVSDVCENKGEDKKGMRKRSHLGSSTLAIVLSVLHLALFPGLQSQLMRWKTW